MGSYSFFFFLNSQVKPDMRPYRVKAIPYYDDLCFLYGDKTSDEKGNLMLVLDTTKL